MYTETKMMITAAIGLMIINCKWIGIMTLIMALIFEKWQREIDKREKDFGNRANNIQSLK